jgi:LytR cell envelope-related transcriptional attenuator
VNRPAGRAPSGGNSAGARGAILLAVAAVLGILLLQAFDTDSGTSVSTGTTLPGGNGSANGATVPTSPVATPTTRPGRAPSEVVVLVANGTGVRGLGTQNADVLKAAGYNTLTAVDATKALDATQVQFAEGYEPDARAIALTLGLQPTAVVALNSPAVPDPQGANVFVLLGADVGRTASSSSSSTSTP